MITKLLEGLPNQSMQQGVFDAAVGKYMADLPAWGAEANALAVDVNAKQVTANEAASAAAASADDAAGSAEETAATAAEATAVTNADRMQTGLDRTAAADSAAAAALASNTATSKADIATIKAAEALASANAAAAVTGIPNIAGNARKVLRVNPGGTGIEWSAAAVVLPIPTLVTQAQAPSGVPINISFSGASSLVSQSIASFIVTWWDGSTQTVAAVGNAGVASKVINGSVGQVKKVSVEAIDTLGNQSVPRTNSITLVANNPPTGTLVISAPTQVLRLSTGNQISFAGITDADAGDSVSYTITDPGLFTLSKLSGIAAGEIVTFSAPAAAVDTASQISVKAVDTVGGETAGVTANITILAAGVIGVVLKATGGGGGTWSHIDRDGADITDPGTSWFNSRAPWSGIVDQTIDAQAMVKIPKFYYKVAVIATGANTGKTAWWISDTATAGFTLHPAFMNAGAEISQFWYGKYQASLTGAKLDSKPGVLPATTSSNFSGFIAAAEARNTGGVTGFMLQSFWQWSAIQFLYLIENKTMDSQTKTGQGRVSQTSTANVDAADVAQATYRGMVGLWGNVYQWMDGLRARLGAIEVWDASGNKTWATTGKTIAVNPYPLTFISDGTPALAAAFLASTAAATGAAATAPDQHITSSTTLYYPTVGGGYGTAAAAGLWCMDCTNSYNVSNQNLGARLAKV